MISLIFAFFFSRIFVGFVLGAAATFFCLPWIEDNVGPLHRPSFDQLVNSGTASFESTSKAINLPPIPDSNRRQVQKALEESSFVMDLVAAITLSKSQPAQAISSDYIIKVISKLVDNDSRISSFVQDRLQKGITNHEAIEIFEQFNALKNKA